MSVRFKAAAVIFGVALAVLAASPTSAAAARQAAPQAPPAPQAPAAPARRGGTASLAQAEAQVQTDRYLVASDENAEQTKERLVRLMEQYPPTLRGVLQRDPSLLHNDAYLAPYQALAAFLRQHPEVAHNPTFFLGTPNGGDYYYSSRNPSSDRARIVGEVFTGFTVLTGFMSFFALLGFMTKTMMDHRRFSQVSKVHDLAHAKLMDRLTSNDDLMAYVQSPAGQRYFNATPIRVDTGSAVTSAPYSRILWSVQAGLVAACIGLGFLFVSSRWAVETDWLNDMSRMLLLMGVVFLAAGLGFVLSGLASFVVSKRLGLIQAASSPTSSHA